MRELKRSVSWRETGSDNTNDIVLPGICSKEIFSWTFSILTAPPRPNHVNCIKVQLFVSVTEAFTLNI